MFEIFEMGCGLLKKASEAVKSIDFNDADQVYFLILMWRMGWKSNGKILVHGLSD